LIHQNITGKLLKNAKQILGAGSYTTLRGIQAGRKNPTHFSGYMEKVM
jgi:hypothetical protein